MITNEYETRKAEMLAKVCQPGMCEYMLLCTRDAVTTVPNPVLGDVPTCQRCADFYNA